MQVTKLLFTVTGDGHGVERCELAIIVIVAREIS